MKRENQPSSREREREKVLLRRSDCSSALRRDETNSPRVAMTFVHMQIV